MPSLNWSVFKSLPGDDSRNFEILCRGLMWLHFGRHGQFKALSNNPGVEFHIKLNSDCSLGNPGQWFGWQCKFHERKQNGSLKSASRIKIELSLNQTKQNYPELMNWVLWTPYTLSKSDQEWYYRLDTKMDLQLWSEAELETYLAGEGLLLRNTYFGELILTSEILKEQHQISVKRIQKRWFKPLHQEVDAERTIRRMLGEPSAWNQMPSMGSELIKAADVIKHGLTNTESELQKEVETFNATCREIGETLLRFHKILAHLDLDVIQQKLAEQKTVINTKVGAVPRRLRISNLPVALVATNALNDMQIAKKLLNEVEELFKVGLVAVLGDAGDGKTQMAAQITAPQPDRPAGVFLHGQDLHKGQTLNDLASHVSINGNPLNSIEKLIASLDSAGKRAACRLPILIDGLNEAENPKNWKSALADLSVVVKKYPNVLVVCTLRTGEHRRGDSITVSQFRVNTRESFAVMALPDDINRIEIEGFGRDVHSAISSYFNYFKITPGDAEIPVELFQHPLTLRIFCEVTNPKRKNEVIIDNFPASLSSLFEKYTANVCERISQMVNLSYSYSTNEVESAIYRFGLELWNVGKREVDEEKFRGLVSDANRPWDSSIINLLAQEGIVFRNPSSEPGKIVIVPVYDALGGHIISSALLSKYYEDTTFEWLKQPEVMKLFVSEDSHELASNIFISLVELTPRRMFGKQLWKEAPESLRNGALMHATTLEASYIDESTVSALLTLFNDNPRSRKFFFLRFKVTRGITNHPLNAEFHDKAIREMPVSVRDLSWTEWVRESWFERFNDLLSMEQRWRDELYLRTPSDRLRAKWVMWHLSSTDRELRDIATRTLYWYGRGDPAGLFEESMKSLEINDPYVPERMLAASYGVAMASHVDIDDENFVSKILPHYARRLYDMMFAIGAPFGTTHILMREYAYRAIEIASKHNPRLFIEEESKRTKPPFADDGLRDWGEINESEEIRGHGSPFRMDFENYTIGRLVPSRGNYDYAHKEYKKVRSQILWRIEQLGWTRDQFEKIDSFIADGHWRSRSIHEAKKTDRYGKKYSWVAYFEMSGLLNDTGVLENWAERTSSVDIDPSFPERVTKERLIDEDFLGNPITNMTDWMNSGPPKVNPYLCLNKLQDEQGPWVSLDGFFAQEDETRNRSIFCFIRSFLVDNKSAASLLGHLSRQNLGGRWLPEKPSVTCTFAGEISWCDIFPDDSASKLTFEVNEKSVIVDKKVSELYLDGERLNLSEIDLLRLRLFGDSIVKDKSKFPLDKKDLQRIEVRDVLIKVEELQKENVEFDVMIPVCDFCWESYHTVASDGGSATALAKNITSDLELIGQPQTFDMFTLDGKRATFNISDQSDSIGNNQSMLFIKEDLLKSYLKKHNLTLLWAIWGERRYSSNIIGKILDDSGNSVQTYQDYSFVSRYE